MSILYPRLLPNETHALFDDLTGLSIEDLRTRAETRSDRAVFAASGGSRVSEDQLRALAETIRALATEHGYPNPVRRSGGSFDSQVARALHVTCGMAPGEAAQPQVWAFLALVVVPDVCVWRWPAGKNETYVADRFKGTDLTRHALGRLWTRAAVLREPADDPVGDHYKLLDALGEADLDQIMARRKSIAASPALVREVVRVQADARHAGGGPDERVVLRQTLMRLLRLLAFLDVDGYDQEALQRLVVETRSEVLERLRAESGSGRAAVG